RKRCGAPCLSAPCRSREAVRLLRRKRNPNTVKFIGMARTRLVAGNWKMHGSRAANQALLDALLSGLPDSRKVECAVCVPYPYLEQVAGRLAGTPLAWGAQ